MRTLPISIRLVLLCVLSQSQMALAENMIKRTYNIADVSELKIKAKGQLDIVLGDQASLVITAPESYLQQLNVGSAGDVLQIKDEEEQNKTNWNKTFANSDVHYQLTLTTLTSISAAGALQLNMLSPLLNDHFSITLAGMIDMNLNHIKLDKTLKIEAYGLSKLNIEQLDADNLSINGVGPVEMEINGQVRQQSLSFTGPVKYKGKYLQTQLVDASFMGPFDVTLWVDDVLKTSALGVGEIEYYGKAKVISKGTSQINFEGDAP